MNEHKRPVGGGEPSVLPAKARWLDRGWSVYIKIALLAIPFCILFYDVFYKLVRKWTNDPTWSHGFLIPLFCLYFLNQKKQDLLQVTPKPNFWGLAGLLLFLAFYPLNLVQFQIGYFGLLIVIPVLASIVLFVGGWPVLRLVWLPIGFLFFAIPLPDRLYEAVTIPMRLFAARLSTVVLNWVPGIESTASGAVIEVFYRGQRLTPDLDVADACSGIRLLMAFVALGVAMAYLHERPAWQRLVLLISTVPIAILCNVIRVIITALIYILWDPRYAQGIYHDTLGILMLPVAFGMYGGLTWMMANLFEEEEPVLPGPSIVRRSSKEMAS